MTIADIETFTRFLTGTDSASLPAATLLILENKYYEEIVGKIIAETAGADWQFGDRNYEAFPSFTIDMTNGTQAYDLNDWGTSDEETILTVMGAEVLDNSGDWHPLTRTSLSKIREAGFAQPEYYPTAGRPIEYEIRDGQVVLYPAPDNGVTVTLTAGLRIYHLRTADRFTSAEVTTGTKEPGFPSPWHNLLSWGPAHDYAIAKGMNNANFFRAKYQEGLDEMLKFISKRDQDVRTVMSGKKIRYI